MSNKLLKRSDIAEAFVNSGYMLLFMVIFSVLGIVFVFMDGYDIVQLIIGVLFIVPIMYIYFYNGSKAGEREFKRLNGLRLEEAKQKGTIIPNVFKGLLYVLPFAIFSLLLAGSCWIANNQVFKIIVLLIYMPITLIGQAFGLISFPRTVVKNQGLENETVEIVGNLTSGSMVFTVIAFYVLLSCLVFWIAFILKVNENKKQFASFVTEISDNKKYTRK